ncbi:type VII secretion system-associated protein [Streptomyces kunmingensis]|uniref:Type VII secretion system-associated protein n=1 Tax=Streptomyces kunmingensis TaxID=68225 RepID=A0ABU6CQ29_9ACTN|nr:type VII secretion system-associated protein [Streptomyces kunmingensis]MEB3966020.1 type VII secretion system-associated protein [Streptomyces kunmingensis]
MTSLSGTPDHEPENTAEADTADGPVGAGPDDPPPALTGGPVQGGPSAVLKGRPGFREPPEDYVKAAKAAPNHWLSVIDRHWNGDEGEPTPSWASLGRWRSDENGEIVEWEVNTDYRPSPDAHGWAPPVSPVDAAVQLVATGYASEDVFALMLADAEVAVCLDEDGGLAVTDAEDGTEAVPVFSPSPELEDDKLPPHEVMSVPALLDRLPEGKEVLFLSSSAPVGQLVTAGSLREAKSDLERYEAEEAADVWSTPPAPSGGSPEGFADVPDLGSVEGWPDFPTDAQWPTDENAEDGPGSDDGPAGRPERPGPGVAGEN